MAFALAHTKSPAEAGDRTFTRWSFSGSGSVGRPDHLDHHPAGRASVGPGAADRPAGGTKWIQNAISRVADAVGTRTSAGQLAAINN